MKNNGNLVFKVYFSFILYYFIPFDNIFYEVT